MLARVDRTSPRDVHQQSPMRVSRHRRTNRCDVQCFLPTSALRQKNRARQWMERFRRRRRKDGSRSCGSCGGHIADHRQKIRAGRPYLERPAPITMRARNTAEEKAHGVHLSDLRYLGVQMRLQSLDAASTCSGLWSACLRSEASTCRLVAKQPGHCGSHSACIASGTRRALVSCTA